MFSCRTRDRKRNQINAGYADHRKLPDRPAAGPRHVCGGELPSVRIAAFRLVARLAEGTSRAIVTPKRRRRRGITLRRRAYDDVAN